MLVIITTQTANEEFLRQQGQGVQRYAEQSKANIRKSLMSVFVGNKQWKQSNERRQLLFVLLRLTMSIDRQIANSKKVGGKVLNFYYYDTLFSLFRCVAKKEKKCNFVLSCFVRLSRTGTTVKVPERVRFWHENVNLSANHSSAFLTRGAVIG